MVGGHLMAWDAAARGPNWSPSPSRAARSGLKVGRLVRCVVGVVAVVVR